MGVYWAKNGSKDLKDKVEIIDLRTIVPLDEEIIFESVKKTGRCLVLTEESISNSFAQALSGKIQKNCFQYLDAPVDYLGAEDVPAIPLNSVLESRMLPNAEKAKAKIMEILAY